MAYSEKTCPQCNNLFIGRNNATYCGDNCRWKYHKMARNRNPEGDSQMKKVKDPEMQKRGKQNRAKGARAEREVCHIIERITGTPTSRNLSQTRDAGSDVEWGPFMLEVKYQQHVAMPAWQQQATISAAEKHLVPAVVYRRPQQEFWISLPFEVFVTMFETLRRAAEANQP